MLAGPRLRCSLRDERNSSVFLIGEASLATERAAALQAAQSSSWCEDIAAAMHRAWSCDASVSARGALGQAVGAAPVAGMSLSMASSSIPRCTLGAPIYRLRSSQIERCHPRRGKWTADPGERVQLGPHGWDLAGEGEVSPSAAPPHCHTSCRATLQRPARPPPAEVLTLWPRGSLIYLVLSSRADGALAWLGARPTLRTTYSNHTTHPAQTT